MRAFVIVNPNGMILAAFRDHGSAVHFCHQNSYSTNWIVEGEINLRTNMGR